MTQVRTVMLTLNKHRLESSCSGLISSLWYVYEQRAWVCWSLFSLFVWIRDYRGHNLLPHPQQHTRLAPSACWQQQRGWAGERPGLIIVRREAVAQEAKQETNGSTDGLLQTHPWGWQSGRAHAERESERDRQRNRDRQRERERGREELKSFSFSFSSRGSYLCSVITKGQQLLQASLGCRGERRRDSLGITLICKMVHTSPSVCQMGYEMSGDRHVKGILCNC